MAEGATEPGVARGIDVIDRVIAAIAVEIGVAAAEAQGIGRDEAAQPRVEPAGPVVVEACVVVPVATGEAEDRVECREAFGRSGAAADGGHRAERIVVDMLLEHMLRLAVPS